LPSQERTEPAPFLARSPWGIHFRGDSEVIARQTGLGVDINGGLHQWPIKNTYVKRPSGGKQRVFAEALAPNAKPDVKL
jgi:hypothetical protein